MLGRTAHSQTSTNAAKRVITFVLAAFVVFGVFASVASAQSLSIAETGIQYGDYTGLTGGDLRLTIANIIRGALGFLGILAILIVLYGGFVYMTAGGSDERIQRAKGILRNGVIGLVIIVTAFAITSFVISRLLGANDLGGGSTGSSGVDNFACIGLTASCPAGALGNGIVDAHYPPRNATGIPRNTRVVVTFKEAFDPTSLILDGDEATVALIKSNAVGVSNQFKDRFAERLTSSDLNIVATDDAKIFVVMQTNCPANCIGSPSENIFYTVALRGGSNGIKKANGDAAFAGTLSSGYVWEFQVSTVLDLTPPKVSFVTPLPDSRENPRNSLIQVNFNEAVDPISVQSGMTVTHLGGTLIDGQLDIGNAYTSVEFRSNDLCGTNSCGEQIYCLPGNDTINSDVKADSLIGDGPTGIFPPNGITDMAGNSLDGNKDGAAVGPSEDNFPFSFETNDTIDLTPPVIIDHQPAVLTGNIPADLRVTATFSKLMSTTSLNTSSARLIPGPSGPPTNYTVVSEHQASIPDGNLDQTEVRFIHDLFTTNQPYSSYFTSGIRDTRQNCFFPGSGQSVCTGSEPFCCNGLPSDVECGFLN